jgi:hypothetical protein
VLGFGSRLEEASMLVLMMLTSMTTTTTTATRVNSKTRRYGGNPR